MMVTMIVMDDDHPWWIKMVLVVHDAGDYGGG